MGILLLSSKRADTMASGLCILFLTMIIPCQSFHHPQHIFKNIGWLSTEEPPTKLGDKEKQCRITGKIWIGKEAGAGTTNHLLVEVYANDVRIIAESYLNRKSESDFKPGAMGSFDLQAKCATPNGIRVMLEGSDAMLLDRIELQREDDVSNKSYVFKCNCSIDKDNPKYIRVEK